ncbi:hypothetical protein [Patiriisocius marinus]|uniref:Uncharacterized protein n=1 Tax=Patiriisocius marinus TaxID=1397112 RepID=A0A5J4IWX8_9FLAO|nr:hypothetical protein [Patiriisocius marinus]GER58071.1 hypothetical protein ULMA_01790 [Patiriisocius marinus]
MREQQEHISIVNYAMIIVMVFGVMFLSTFQTISLLLDINVDNIAMSAEEEPEEEKRTEKKIKDIRISPSSNTDLTDNAPYTALKSLFKADENVLDYTLEIQIPPPKYV